MRMKRQCPVCRTDIPRGEFPKQIYIVDEAVDNLRAFTRKRALEVMKAETQLESTLLKLRQADYNILRLKERLEKAESRVSHLRTSREELKTQIGKLIRTNSAESISDSSEGGNEDVVGASDQP